MALNRPVNHTIMKTLNCTFRVNIDTAFSNRCRHLWWWRQLFDKENENNATDWPIKNLFPRFSYHHFLVFFHPVAVWFFPSLSTVATFVSVFNICGASSLTPSSLSYFLHVFVIIFSLSLSLSLSLSHLPLSLYFCIFSLLCSCISRALGGMVDLRRHFRSFLIPLIHY